MKEIKFLNKIQSEKLLETIKLQRHKIIVLLMLDCGLRVSETITLRYSNFDFKNKLVVVESLKKRSKSLKRKVPLSNRLYQELAKYLSKNNSVVSTDFLFPSNSNSSGHVTRSSVNKFLENIRKKLNYRSKRPEFTSYFFNDDENGFRTLLRDINNNKMKVKLKNGYDEDPTNLFNDLSTYTFASEGNPNGETPPML
jgi:integrase